MLNRVVHVTPLARHRLFVEFDDGVCGTIDLTDRLFGEMFEPLRDEAVFHQAYVDEYGTVCWPNGADLAPDAVHETLVRRRFPSPVNHRSAKASVGSSTECVQQLLEVIADIDRDDIRQAIERLARVQEWIIRETERMPEGPIPKNGRLISG